MNTQQTDKRDYSAPALELVKLDNEMALQLESTPPEGPGEGYLKVPEYFNSDPLKDNLG